ncbi:MAG: PQQ-binding-like beta-propeller repeat protein [Dokdonella sp.]
MQFGYDAAHTGNNTAEAAVSASNVAQFIKLYQTTLAASVDSAPVYRSNVVTPSGTKNLLFALSESGRLMAIDAATGAEVWFKTTSGKQPTASSPAIDPGGLFVYSYGIDGKVHKYQIGNGTEVMTGGWPQVVTLKPDVEKGASGLTIATSATTTYLYSVTDGYIGDGGDYQGHLSTINLANGTQTIFNTLCSDQTIHFALNGTPGVNDCASKQSGIWGRGGAAFSSVLNRVYIATGNGPFNANVHGFNWADSVVALAPNGAGNSGTPLDSYTPSSYAGLQGADADLGSTSLALLPPLTGSLYLHVGAMVGKDACVRLINLDNMSGSSEAGHVGGELQQQGLPTTSNCTNGNNADSSHRAFAQPAVWTATDGSSWVFIAVGSGVFAYHLNIDGGGHPTLVSTWSKTGASTSPVIANGVLYHIGICSGSPCVIARNPADGTQLWASEHLGSVHWNSPIMVNGKVFVADKSAKLWAFGLASPSIHVVTPSAGANGSMTPSVPQNVNDGATTTFTVSSFANYAIGTVTGCGGHLAGNTYTTGAITSDCTVSATFVANDVIFRNGFDP